MISTVIRTPLCSGVSATRGDGFATIDIEGDHAALAPALAAANAALANFNLKLRVADQLRLAMDAHDEGVALYERCVKHRRILPELGVLTEEQTAQFAARRAQDGF